MPLFRSSKSSGPRLSFQPSEVDGLVARLRAQTAFTRGYSGLFTAMLDSFVTWLSDPQAASDRLEDTSIISFCNRLVEFAQDGMWKYDLEASLRFAAALHEYILAHDPRVESLCGYYQTCGGQLDPSDAQFERALLAAVDGLGELLFERARLQPVQTNETSRGLTWLLPCVLVGIDAVHLIEFGASAGLNLYAEQRAYDLCWADAATIRLGGGEGTQFVVDMKSTPYLGEISQAASRGPEVLSRVGGDIAPLALGDLQAERHLAACVWGDQPQRLARLREGIAIHRKAVDGELSPTAEVHCMTLPDEVQEFLRRYAPTKPKAPVVSFNTVVTNYLNDVDQRAVLRQVRDFAHRWSVQHAMPWMWVRFEPARPGEATEPHRGWCRWLVELFEGAQHRVLDLGWAHPHLHEVELNERCLELRDLAPAAASTAAPLGADL